MKKLLDNSRNAVVRIQLGWTCNFCYEPMKVCVSPSVGQAVYICRDCCIEAAKLLRDYEPVPDQTPSSPNVPPF